MKNHKRTPSFAAFAALCLLGTTAGLAGCTSLQSIAVTQVPRDRTRPVRVQADDWGLFGINFDNDFVDGIPAALQSQCPGGVVSGILTKHESAFYFFVVTRTVTATGFCTQSTAAPGWAPPPPPPGAPPGPPPRPHPGGAR